MQRVAMLVFGFLCLMHLLGCQGPGQTIPAPLLAPVEARLALGGFHLQTVLTSYQSTQIDHVRLVLLGGPSTGYAALGPTTAIARANFGANIHLGNLKLATAYRVRVDAYSAVAESPATLISDPTRSTTDFTTPAASVTNGISSVNDTPGVLVSLRVGLRDQTFAGHATFQVNLSAGLKSKVSTIKVTLFSGATTVFQKTYAVAKVNAGQILAIANLRLDTAYTLQADGYNASNVLQSKPANSDVAITTPAVVADQIDDAVGATPFALPCK